MAVVRYTAGQELTPDQEAAMLAEVQAAAMRPYVDDPDCPLLTERQLAGFKPVHFASPEERIRAMRQEAPALVSGK